MSLDPPSYPRGVVACWRCNRETRYPATCADCLQPMCSLCWRMHRDEACEGDQHTKI